MALYASVFNVLVGFEAVAGKFHVVFAHEGEYFFAHGRWVDVGFYPLQGVEHRCRTLVYVAVRFGDVVDLLLGESAVFLHHYGVDAVVAHWIVGHDYERGHIGAYARAALYEHVLAFLSSSKAATTWYPASLNPKDNAPIPASITATVLIPMFPASSLTCDLSSRIISLISIVNL